VTRLVLAVLIVVPLATPSGAPASFAPRTDQALRGAPPAAAYSRPLGIAGDPFNGRGSPRQRSASEHSASGSRTRGAETAGGAPLTGLATWYRWHPGQAAAGPALRAALGSHWRSQSVRVCASVCVTVTLSDYCACQRLIDLDSRSFVVLAPLSQGVVRVTVTTGPVPTGPPTDVGP